jgi:hypothetical protein
MKVYLVGQPWEISDIIGAIQEYVPVDRIGEPRRRGNVTHVGISITEDALDRAREKKMAAVVPLFPRTAGGAHCHCPSRPPAGQLCPACGGVGQRVAL